MITVAGYLKISKTHSQDLTRKSSATAAEAERCFDFILHPFSTLVSHRLHRVALLGEECSH
jgi:hypothetical protein